jgi:hypothetical protein
MGTIYVERLRLVHIDKTYSMANVEDVDAGSEPSAQLYGLEGSIDGADRPLLLVPAGTVMPTRKPKHLAPQQAVDGFWTRFNSKVPGKGDRFEPVDNACR